MTLITYIYDNRDDVSSGNAEPHQDPAQFGGQSGYYTDIETGEALLTHRYYDAGTGHFLNRDPIGYAGGENLYAFCGNNPITGSDPNGTDIDFDPTTDTPENERLWRKAIKYLEKCPEFKTVVLKEIRGNHIDTWHVVFDNDFVSETHPNIGNTIMRDPHFAAPAYDSKDRPTGHTISPALSLGHELTHAYHNDINATTTTVPVNYPANSPDARYDTSEEKSVITGMERKLAHCLKEHIRDSHHGDPDDPDVTHHVADPLDHR